MKGDILCLPETQYEYFQVPGSSLTRHLVSRYKVCVPFEKRYDIETEIYFY
jgi:hypothetical protein